MYWATKPAPASGEMSPSPKISSMRTFGSVVFPLIVFISLMMLLLLQHRWWLAFICLIPVWIIVADTFQPGHLLRHLRIKMERPAPVCCGGISYIPVTIRSASWVPTLLEAYLGEESEGAVSVGLGWVNRRHVLSLTLPLPAKQRGHWALPPLTLKVGSSCGLSTVGSSVDSGEQYWIYPQLLSQQGDPPKPAVRKHSFFHPDAEEIFLRPVRPDESVPPSAHRLSLHLGHPIGFESFTPQTLPEDRCLRWTDHAGIGTREQIISALASEVARLDKAGAAYSLDLPGVHLSLASGQQHYHACMQALAGLPV